MNLSARLEVVEGDRGGRVDLRVARSRGDGLARSARLERVGGERGGGEDDLLRSGHLVDGWEDEADRLKCCLDVTVMKQGGMMAIMHVKSYSFPGNFVVDFRNFVETPRGK